MSASNVNVNANIGATRASPWRRGARAVGQGSARLRQAWMARQPRERQVLLLAAALLCLATIDQGLWSPSQKARAALQAQLSSEESKRNEQRQALESRRSNAARLLAQEEELRERIARADQELTELRASVTPAPEMLARLRQFSAFEGRLKLVGLTLEPAEPVLAGAGGLYRLPVLVTVEGDYAAITAYLQQLETGQGGLRWRTLDLQTRDWPLLRLKLRVFTLGEQASWPV